VQYRFDWGDGGAYSDWTSLVNSGNSSSKSKSWSSSGTYSVKSQARDEHGAVSGWSSGLTVTVTSGYTPPSNSAPNTPSKPSGNISGYTNVTYTYSTSTTDSDGDQVQYKFDWGDSTTSDWTTLGTSGHTGSASHLWSTPGSYSVKAKAKDEHGKESTSWSTTLVINIQLNPDDTVDTDGDGMPDYWENQYDFLDPTDQTDAGEDYDNDGYTNLEEYLQGTDPSKPDYGWLEINWQYLLISLILLILLLVLLIYGIRRYES
jgi:hypothetical protein